MLGVKTDIYKIQLSKSPCSTYRWMGYEERIRSGSLIYSVMVNESIAYTECEIFILDLNNNNNLRSEG